MTAYRFRVKFDRDPTSLWRDVVVGADRTVAEFQTAINAAVGLDQDHLWFVGTDEDYWNSDVVYQCPREYEERTGASPLSGPKRIENAGAVTIGELTRQLRARTVRPDLLPLRLRRRVALLRHPQGVPERRIQRHGTDGREQKGRRHRPVRADAQSRER